MFIARKGDTTTLGAEGPVKLKNLKNPRGEAPSTFPFEPSEPSGRSPVNPHTAGVSNGALIDRQNDAIP